MHFKSTVIGLVALSASALTVSARSLPLETRQDIVDGVESGEAARPPPPPPQGKCKANKKLKRKAWHNLTIKEKKDYIKAEKCLMAKPATLGLPSTANRFEELQSIHQIPASITHNVGAFLPYHRLHMHAHEKSLRDECGYKGAQPYWDEPRDAGHFSTSDVLDPITGFGGDGAGGNGNVALNCINNGPFNGFTNNLGPGYTINNPHCINRLVNDTVSLMVGQAYVNECLAYPTYAGFWPCLENAPHIGGHGGVGGLMLDPIASPGDPIFYLHHTWLDKVFWDWQKLNLPARLSDISGNNLPGPFPPGAPTTPGGLPLFFPPLEAFPPFGTLIPPPGSPLPTGDPGNETTLTHVLDMLGVIPSATIKDVMDIGGDLLCYEYV